MADPILPALDLAIPVADPGARARFRLIAALLEPLIAEATGETQEGLRAVRDIAARAAGGSAES